MVTVRFEKCFNGIGVGGGGGSSGGKVNSEIARVLGNHALAILFTYLFMIGQVGWLLDAIVALWVLLSLFLISDMYSFLVSDVWLSVIFPSTYPSAKYTGFIFYHGYGFTLQSKL